MASLHSVCVFDTLLDSLCRQMSLCLQHMGILGKFSYGLGVSVCLSVYPLGATAAAIFAISGRCKLSHNLGRQINQKSACIAP